MRAMWRCVAAAVALAIAPQWAAAHFLWIVAGGQSPDGKVHLYFSESASPDDPDLLDRLKGLRLRQAVPGRLEELPITKGEDSLVALSRQAGASTLFVSHTYGAITRGEETFLLKYHAKCYSSERPQTWIAVGDAEALPLEIVPRLDGDKTVLTVLWQNTPLEGGLVTITGGGLDKLEGTTDKRGEFVAELPPGRKYSIRAKHSDDQVGDQDGKAYKSVRHYATLALELPAHPPQSNLPPLDPGMTSFGAAIVGDYLYVYGGHLGAAHHYSEEGQSGRFARLNLKEPGVWEELPSVPKRTGLAMVPHRGKIYRIGGFVAKNKESEEQLLVSTSDVAVYDPATSHWTELTPLPAGRSSHDAVVIGDKLYVVGGWSLNGRDDTQWHDSALVADLSHSTLAWESIPVPFRRRALSVAEWHGKLVVIGGMQEAGGPTTAAAIFDPVASTWSDGPSIVGNAMDGFGSSAFALGDELYVSTMSGKLQRLSRDGSRWHVVAQLQHPRFFHRMLPVDRDRLLFVGGASMRSGKIGELEWWTAATDH